MGVIPLFFIGTSLKPWFFMGEFHIPLGPYHGELQGQVTGTWFPSRASAGPRPAQALLCFGDEVVNMRNGRVE